ncbi:MAG: hypothetical protein P8X96_03980 [Desulfobacteraceae bacterium]|jgi:hypothetical protein
MAILILLSKTPNTLFAALSGNRCRCISADLPRRCIVLIDRPKLWRIGAESSTGDHLCEGMMAELTTSQFLTFVLEVVEQNGCHLAEIDFDKKVIHIEGAEEDKIECATALKDILG